LFEWNGRERRSQENHFHIRFIEVDHAFEIEQAVTKEEHGHLLVAIASDQGAGIDESVLRGERGDRQKARGECEKGSKNVATTQ
jgi:hypothetical protein